MFDSIWNIISDWISQSYELFEVNFFFKCWFSQENSCSANLAVQFKIKKVTNYGHKVEQNHLLVFLSLSSLSHQLANILVVLTLYQFEPTLLMLHTTKSSTDQQPIGTDQITQHRLDDIIATLFSSWFQSKSA